jgi:hypothetical protein
MPIIFLINDRDAGISKDQSCWLLEKSLRHATHLQPSVLDGSFYSRMYRRQNNRPTPTPFPKHESEGRGGRLASKPRRHLVCFRQRPPRRRRDNRPPLVGATFGRSRAEGTASGSQMFRATSITIPIPITSAASAMGSLIEPMPTLYRHHAPRKQQKPPRGGPIGSVSVVQHGRSRRQP